MSRQDLFTLGQERPKGEIKFRCKPVSKGRYTGGCFGHTPLDCSDSYIASN